MRQLSIIPIVHASADLGSLAFSASEAKSRAEEIGKKVLSSRCIDTFWQELKLGIKTWEQDFRSLYVFQDSLPVVSSNQESSVEPESATNVELSIVRELAEKGSQNHAIVEWLVSEGATLVGTESPPLLVAEYEAMKKILDASVSNSEGDIAESMASSVDIDSLREQRDTFIAQRIDACLPVDGSGILFIGLSHKVEPHLSTDISVSYPFGKPKGAETAGQFND